MRLLSESSAPSYFCGALHVAFVVRLLLLVLPEFGFAASALRETFCYNRTLLNPDPRCPEFVQARHWRGEGYAGLGHSFFTFHQLIHIASAHNVTVKARYTSSGHTLNSTLVDAFFFGDFFDVPLPRSLAQGLPAANKTSVQPPPMNSLVPAFPSSSAIKVVECPDVENFTQTLSMYRARGCINNTATVYIIDSPMQQWNKSIDTRLYRTAYAANQQFRDAYVARRSGLDEHSTVMKGAVSPRNSSTCITIAVHIRRGDIVRASAKHRLRDRWVPNRAYIQVIDAVHRSLLKQKNEVGVYAPSTTDGSCRLCIELYVEGATSPSHIPDLDPDNVQGHTNFQDKLGRYGSVNVIQSDALSSFDRACNADILITGRSSFSYLMSLLCELPVVLAFPWLAFPWIQSYESMPNAMTVTTVVQNRTLITGATINETQFLALVKQQGLACH